MSISGDDKLIEKLESIKKVNVQLAGVGTQVALAIHERTLNGRDVNGKPFAPYSDKYKALRQKHGRSGTVNLNDKGFMLGNMTNRVEGNSVTIYFSKEKENAKALGHNTGGGHLPVRKFFGISKTETDNIIEKVFGYYRKAVQK